MGLIGWIIIGGIAGWLASAIASAPRTGCLWNIVLGCLGAVVGGMLWGATQEEDFDFDFSLPSLGIATVGAIVLLLLINLVTARTRAGKK